MADDKLLDLVFSDSEIWERAINDGADKKIKHRVLENYSDPNYREKIKEQIANHAYHVKPPHEAQIPKDDGTMRTVYANEAEDRVLLTVINNILFKHCPEMIHPSCMSYQIGIGCGKIDKKVVRDIQEIGGLGDGGQTGYKIDLSKYFDSVPIEYIDAVFNAVVDKFGKSSIIDLLSEYYHSDVLLDLERKEIHKYTSLRQGCAVAAFLADSVLYDIDETICKYDVLYYRYSDDILILGKEADDAFLKISEMLEQRSLKLNPKKVERLDGNKWFTFLGFSIKGNTITLSKKRIKNLQKAIMDRTLKVKSKKQTSRSAMHSIYSYLYDTSITKYGYAEGILPVINCKADIQQIDCFILDCIRASGTKRRKIGGLGYDKSGKDGVIVRGRGRNVSKNREKQPKVDGYVTMSHMQTLFNTNREVYEAYVRELMFN